MFGRRGKNRELEELLRRVELEAENNYKDAAQKAFAVFEGRLEELRRAGALNERTLRSYEERAEEKRALLEGFRHVRR